MSVFWGGFSLSDISWKGHTVGCKQYRRILEDARDKIFTQKLNGPNKGDIQLDLIFTKKEELVVDVIISGSLGCSDQEIVAFKILRGVRQASRTVQTRNFEINLCFFQTADR